jgi:hypothetical protein
MCHCDAGMCEHQPDCRKHKMKTVDLTNQAPEQRSVSDRVDRLRVRVKEAKTSRDVLNAILGVLDLLADEL